MSDVVRAPGAASEASAVYGSSDSGESLLAAERVERRLSALANHLVTDFVVQAAYASAIFPSAINTLRLITMIGSDHVPFIAYGQHRFGTARSAPADNIGAGGILSDIDLEDGRLGAALETAGPDQLTWLERHPATGDHITGVRIPQWPAVRDGVLRAAAVTPFLPYIGWDVIVTDDGFQIVEGNKSPDRPGPLLRNPRARAFFAAHRIS